MRVLVTVDTEADNQWSDEPAAPVENLKSLPRFQELCDRHGLRPTYLCTYEVVQAPEFVSHLVPWQAAGGAEIGAHLHPWSTPPYDAEWPENSIRRPYPSELPVALFRQKMTRLTEALRLRAGVAPRSYRAGRWGFVAAHIPVLLDLGYAVDGSVTPGVSWRKYRGDRTGGPDFRRAPVAPYELDAGDVCRAGRSGLCEVPVTILLRDAAPLRIPALRRAYLASRDNPVGQVLNRAFHWGPHWLRPYPQLSADDLIALCEQARRGGLPVLSLMLHSSELLAGASPYNPTPESIEALHAKLDLLFAHLARTGVAGATQGEIRCPVASVAA